jgi:hypothetical protein
VKVDLPPKRRHYQLWKGMLNRCYDTKNISYRLYGAKGIKVCKRWHSFENFIKDMGVRTDLSLSLDRIDGTKGYSKKNCRWVSKADQNRNKVNNVRITARGETRLAHHWEPDAAVTRPAFMRRIKNGWAPEKAIFTPADQGSGARARKGKSK